MAEPEEKEEKKEEGKEEGTANNLGSKLKKGFGKYEYWIIGIGAATLFVTFLIFRKGASSYTTPVTTTSATPSQGTDGTNYSDGTAGYTYDNSGNAINPWLENYTLLNSIIDKLSKMGNGNNNNGGSGNGGSGNGGSGNGGSGNPSPLPQPAPTTNNSYSGLPYTPPTNPHPITQVVPIGAPVHVDMPPARYPILTTNLGGHI